MQSELKSTAVISAIESETKLEHLFSYTNSMMRSEICFAICSIRVTNINQRVVNFYY